MRSPMFLAMSVALSLTPYSAARAQQAPPSPPEVTPATTPPNVPAATPAIPLPVTTDAWTPTYTASFFVRNELRSGYDDLGVARAPRFLEGDATFYRARLGIGTGLLDTGSRLRVGLQFTPQASGVLGTLPNTQSDAPLSLHEGYVRVMGRVVRADVGRFELNYGDALVIGNLDWGQTGRSFDGARARIAVGDTQAWIDVFATQIAEGRPDITKMGDGDVYFLGIYAALGPIITQGLDLDAYALARAWPDTQGLKLDPGSAMGATYDRDAAFEATLGGRAKQNFGLIDYRLEAGLQAGARPDAAPKPGTTPAPTAQNVRDVLAYQADLEVGLNVVPDRLRIAAEGVLASGDDPTSKKNEGWDELYPTAHKWLGLSDAFAQNGIKRANVASGVFHATSTLLPGLVLQADGHLFARLEDAGASEKGIAAVEVDVGLTHVLTKGLKLHGLYALFLPSDKGYPGRGNADAAQFGEIELRYDL